MTELALELDEVVASRSGRRVLDGLSLRIAPGEAVALVGANGAGKSTLFEVLAGLHPLEAGHVRLGGQRVDRWPLHRRARAGLGYLPQAPSVFRGLTVADNLTAVLELRRGLDRAQRRAVRAALLDQLGLTELADRRAEHLSGGERRRTELARLLATGPRILALDEPFASLDAAACADLQARLRALIEQGATVLFSDHVRPRAAELADRIEALQGGKISAAPLDG